MATEDVVGTYIIPALIAGAVSLVGILLQSRKETKKADREAIERAKQASADTSVAAKNYITSLLALENERFKQCVVFQFEVDNRGMHAGYTHKDAYMFLGKLGEEISAGCSPERRKMEEDRSQARASLILCNANLLTEAPGLLLHKDYEKVRSAVNMALSVFDEYPRSDPQSFDEEQAILRAGLERMRKCYNAIDPWLISQSSHLRKLSTSWLYRLLNWFNHYKSPENAGQEGVI